MRQILIKIWSDFWGKYKFIFLHAWSGAKILLHKNAIKPVCTTALLKGPNLLIYSAIWALTTNCEPGSGFTGHGTHVRCQVSGVICHSQTVSARDLKC